MLRLLFAIALLCPLQAPAKPASLTDCVRHFQARLHRALNPPVELLFGINKKGELAPERRRLQAQTPNPVLTWFDFTKYKLYREDFTALFHDKFVTALRNAAARHPGGEPFIHFVLDGLDPAQVWTSWGFTNSEIRILFEHPQWLARTRWYLNGQEIDGLEYLSPFIPSQPGT